MEESFITKLVIIGNSKGVVLKKKILAAASISLSSQLEITVKNGSIIIKVHDKTPGIKKR